MAPGVLRAVALRPSGVAGVGDLQGRGRGLHPGGVGAAGPFSEGAVQGGHAGELQEPAVPGASSSQTRCGLPAGARGRPGDAGERRLKRLLSRLGD
ncbi:uncharacterized protein ACOB8E_019663 isoform 4-T8 [Sarcophilus harrisii]